MSPSPQAYTMLWVLGPLPGLCIHPPCAGLSVGEWNLRILAGRLIGSEFIPELGLPLDALAVGWSPDGKSWEPGLASSAVLYAIIKLQEF